MQILTLNIMNFKYISPQLILECLYQIILFYMRWVAYLAFEFHSSRVIKVNKHKCPCKLSLPNGMFWMFSYGITPQLSPIAISFDHRTRCTVKSQRINVLYTIFACDGYKLQTRSWLLSISSGNWWTELPTAFCSSFYLAVTIINRHSVMHVPN